MMIEEECNTITDIKKCTAVLGLGVVTLAGAGASLVVGKVAFLPFVTGVGATCLFRMMWDKIAEKKP